MPQAAGQAVPSSQGPGSAPPSAALSASLRAAATSAPLSSIKAAADD